MLREQGKEGCGLFLLMDDEGAVRLCSPAQARDHGVGQLSWKALWFMALKAGMEEKGEA